MINKRVDRIKKYCCEDISLIENYNEAIIDKEQTWEIHHKLEIELNKTQKELMELNLYYNRPAIELIFLTKSEHSKIHSIGNKRFKGHKLSDETKQKMADGRRLSYQKLKHASIQISGNMHSSSLF